MMAGDPTLSAVGSRGAARNFLSLHYVSYFDAFFADAQSRLLFDVYLAHQNTAKGAGEITELIRGKHAFIIAADASKRLAMMMKRRALIKDRR